MAQSGTLSQSGTQGNAVLANAVTAGQEVIATLGNAAASLLAKSTVKLMIFINAVSRRVHATTTDASAKADSIAQIEPIAIKLGTLTPDDTTKKVTSWTRTPITGETPSATIDAVEAVLAPSKPAFSLSALLSKMEDAIPSVSAGNRMVAIADQETGTVELFLVPADADVETKISQAITAAGVTELADIAQAINEGDPGVPNFAFE